MMHKFKYKGNVYTAERTRFGTLLMPYTVEDEYIAIPDLMYEAVRGYIKNDGYAGLSLQEYLDNLGFID